MTATSTRPFKPVDGVLIGKFIQRGCDNPNEWNSLWTQTRIKVIKETKTSVVKMEQKQSKIFPQMLLLLNAFWRATPSAYCDVLL
ncbi:hypothetical protein RUM43_003534 [Polyplax serrata]|uniref:Uncharacterized protein n=1 Tax=Polyplax serrata TaxID=468196 RepID=A0AAN8P2H0_POLSC